MFVAIGCGRFSAFFRFACQHFEFNIHYVVAQEFASSASHRRCVLEEANEMFAKNRKKCKQCVPWFEGRRKPNGCALLLAHFE